MVSNISFNGINQNQFIDNTKLVAKNVGNTAQKVADEAVDTFSSTAKSGMTSAGLFEGIPFINLLRKNKKLEGKAYSEGMKKLQATLDQAKKELLKGEGKFTTRLKNYFKAVDENQKAYSNLRSEVTKKFKANKNGTTVVKDVVQEATEETVKKAPSKLTAPLKKVAEQVGKKFPKLAKVGGKFAKLMKTSGAGFMLAISGIMEMCTEVIPTFKELGAKKGMKQAGKSAIRVVGDTAGYILGAKAGAAIGSFICPGIGTAAGAAIGLVGGLLGSFLIGKVTKAITGPSEREIAQKQQEQNINQNNPFEKQEHLYCTTA